MAHFVVVLRWFLLFFLSWIQISSGSNRSLDRFEPLADHRRLINFDLRDLADNRNYTCDELIRWLGTEKHYSNDKKNVLFGMLAESGQSCQSQPYVKLKDVSFGVAKNARTFFYNPGISNGIPSKSCGATDELVVVFLSNYSINNNFSHFLHALVRLFCALVDSKIIVWQADKETFVVRHKYTVWLDEYFKLSPVKTIM